MFNYYLFASLFGWIFPTKEDAKNFRHFCKEIDERKKISLIHSRYPQIIERLKNKYGKEKIKVVILNDTVAKWQYQSLYDELISNTAFDVQILITVMDYQMKAKVKKFVDYRQVAENCYNFFRNNKMRVEYAFDFQKNKPIDLREFKPDIIFYEQPWCLFDIQNIEETSKYALSCYSSYGSTITVGKNEYASLFYKLIYRYFIDNEYTKWLLIEHGTPKDCVIVSGHPKLDNYLHPLNPNNTYWKYDNKKRIIISPHFSFYSKSGLHAGTFDKNYKFFLEFAKKHTEYEFIFKPHPRLKEDIIRRKLMSVNECDDYYNQWANLPNTQLVETGNYIDMFRTSDLLITDCNSFLFEYLPTTKPIIRLINEDFIGHNFFGQKIIAGYYSAKDNNQIEELIEQLLVKAEDPHKDVRLNLLNSNIHPKEGYAKFVTNYLSNILRN